MLVGGFARDGDRFLQAAEVRRKGEILADMDPRIRSQAPAKRLVQQQLTKMIFHP